MVFGTGAGYNVSFCWNCLAILPVTVKYKDGSEDCECQSGAKESIVECLICTRCLKTIIKPKEKAEESN